MNTGGYIPQNQPGWMGKIIAFVLILFILAAFALSGSDLANPIAALSRFFNDRQNQEVNSAKELYDLERQQAEDLQQMEFKRNWHLLTQDLTVGAGILLAACLLALSVGVAIRIARGGQPRPAAGAQPFAPQPRPAVGRSDAERQRQRPDVDRPRRRAPVVPGTHGYPISPDRPGRPQMNRYASESRGGSYEPSYESDWPDAGE